MDRHRDKGSVRLSRHRDMEDELREGGQGVDTDMSVVFVATSAPTQDLSAHAQRTDTNGNRHT